MRREWVGLGVWGLLVGVVALLGLGCGAPEAPSDAPPSDRARLVAALDAKPDLSETSVGVRSEGQRDGSTQRLLRITTHVDADTFSSPTRLSVLETEIKREAKRLYGSINEMDYVLVVFVNRRGIGPLQFTRNQWSVATPPRDID
jgi:hypothetical protein